MSIPRSIEARRYYRVALQRLEDGQLILAKLERYPAAIYLAGYGIECILKALMLSLVPPAKQGAYIKEHFRGAKGHDIWLLLENMRLLKGPRFPRAISRDFTLVSTWSVDIRYTPGEGDATEAEEFVQAAERIIGFCASRIS